MGRETPTLKMEREKRLRRNAEGRARGGASVVSQSPTLRWEQPITPGWTGASPEMSQVGDIESGFWPGQSQGALQNWLPSEPHWLPLKRGDPLGPEHRN